MMSWHRLPGIVIQDTVPDRVLNWADQVELIDLPPEELIKRWQEGKVHVPHWSSGMMKQFFREGNLTALRELALRWTARRGCPDECLYAEAVYSRSLGGGRTPDGLCQFQPADAAIDPYRQPTRA